MPSVSSLRPSGEAGFTLPELLVVLILIGILTAIVLPMFLREEAKAGDAAAKSDVRNLATIVTDCGLGGHDFHNCDTKAELGSPSYDFGTGPGQIDVTASADDEFDVTAVSLAKSGGANHSFTWHRSSNGRATRTCVAGTGNDDGGCSDGNW